MENIIALVLPVLIAVLVIKFLFSQVKLIWKIAVNSLSGFVCLWLLNLAGGIVMTQAILVVIGILFSDIALAFLDPRIRYSGGGR
mgnify:CR=1 FL=1